MARRDLLCLGLLGALTLAVYWNGLTGEFLFDDRPYVTKNPQVTEGAPIFGSETPPGRPELGLYRPIFILTLRWNYLAGGLKPSLFHGTNLLLHLACTAALYFLVLRLARDRAAAFLAALLFAVHPVHVEAVTWIVGRAELLSCLFCLLAAHAHFSAARKPPWRMAEALCFVLALLSKENALVFPLVVWAVERYALPPGDRPAPGGWRGVLTRFGIYAVLLPAVVLWRFHVLGRMHPALETAPFKDLPLVPGRVSAALASLAEYLRLFVAPYPLKIFYHASELRSITLLRAGILVLFAVLLFRTLRGRDPLGGWFLWIPLALLPVLNLVPIGAVFAERFAYLPSAGACAAAGLACRRLLKWEAARKGTHTLAWIPVAAYIAFAALTIARNPVFRNSYTLWKDAVVKGGRFAFPHYNLGESYFEQGIFEYQSPEVWGAVAELKESLRLNPDHPYAFAAHYRLGQYYFEERYRKTRSRVDLEAAARHFALSVKTGPPVPEKWKPALALALIAGEPGGGQVVPLEAARRYLALARSLGAPEVSARRVARMLEGMEKEKASKRKEEGKKPPTP